MFSHRWTILSLTLMVFAGAFPEAQASNEMADRDQVRKRLSVESYSPSTLAHLKIAILDNGFEGFDPEKGLLPKSAELIQLTKIGAASTDHGLGMAQIIWGLTGKVADGPKFYLVNTNGFSNFKAAIQFLIDKKIDIALYSQVWPFGGNFDGRGFINALVTKAIQSGVLWINAAGNHGGMIHNGKILERAKASGQFFTFNDGRDHLRFESSLDDNSLSLTLSWTDFEETELYNTPKDLDLFVYNEAGKLVASSELIQKGEAPPETGTSQLSSHAREALVIKGLDRGKYQIKVRMQSNNFEPKDRYRVLINPGKEGSITFTDKTIGAEIMPPADNALALTIGEMSAESSVGPTLEGRVKPEVILQDASVAFTNGNAYQGTSTAAALFTGVLTLLKSEAPTLDAFRLRKLISGFLAPPVSYSDLKSAEGRKTDPAVKRLMPPGSTLMLQTNGHEVILVPQEPFSLPGAVANKLKPNQPDDLLVVSPWTNRWSVVPKSAAAQIKAPLVEFRRVPSASRVWKTPNKTELKRWVTP